MVSDSGMWVRAEIYEKVGGEGGCVFGRGGLHRTKGTKGGEDSTVDGMCVIQQNVDQLLNMRFSCWWEEGRLIICG